MVVHWCRDRPQVACTRSYPEVWSNQKETESSEDKMGWSGLDDQTKKKIEREIITHTEHIKFGNLHRLQECCLNRDRC